jgi:hypothetical protein
MRLTANVIGGRRPAADPTINAPHQVSDPILSYFYLLSIS